MSYELIGSVRPGVKGRLPALKGIVENGVIGNIATLGPPMSPMLWTFISIGRHPDKDGMVGFTGPASDGNNIRPANITSRKVKADWNFRIDNIFHIIN